MKEPAYQFFKWLRFRHKSNHYPCPVAAADGDTDTNAELHRREGVQSMQIR